jgi:hypothetical protein
MAEMLILAAQGQRPVMFADIAMRRALHAGKTAPPRERRRKPVKTHRSLTRSGPFHFPFVLSPISIGWRNASERVMSFALAQASTSAIRAGGMRAAM